MSPIPPEIATGMTRAKRKSAEHWHDADESRWAARQWARRLESYSTDSNSLDEAHVGLSVHGWSSDVGHSPRSAPEKLREFVIVHELVHLLAPNHGRVFKSFMLAYLPDWAEREDRLNQRYNADVLSGLTAIAEYSSRASGLEWATLVALGFARD